MRFSKPKVMGFLFFSLVFSNGKTLYAQLTGNASPPVTFTKKQVYKHYISEGAAIADIDQDGHPDIISGPLWWKGPDFTRFTAYDTLVHYPITGPGTSGYSRIFFTFPGDFDGEGSPDILQISLPGEDSRVFYNPVEAGNNAKAYPAIPQVANESPLVADITGDGKPKLVAFSDGQLVLGLAPAGDRNEWTVIPLSARDKDRFAIYSHGLGYGDINGDGHLDIVENKGWWEHPAKWDQKTLWPFHPFQFSGQAGGSQMLVFDVNGDGLNDVVTAMNAHGYGLSWFEQRSGTVGETVGFEKHEILSEDPTSSVSELNFSQLHAMAKADIDGDGLMDFVTGKCFYAHNGHDPGASDPAVLYWFRTVRNPGGTVMVPYLIDSDSGLGRHISIGDLNGDGKADIVSSNKKGVFMFLQD